MTLSSAGAASARRSALSKSNSTSAARLILISPPVPGLEFAFKSLQYFVASRVGQELVALVFGWIDVEQFLPMKGIGDRLRARREEAAPAWPRAIDIPPANQQCAATDPFGFKQF